MKSTTALVILILFSSLNSLANQNPPIKNFRSLAEVNTLKVDNSSDMVNLAPNIFYAQEDDLNNIQLFGDRKLSQVIRHRLTQRLLLKKKSELSGSWWYAKIKNTMKASQLYYLKIGNNKVSEIICYQFKKGKDKYYKKDILGLTYYDKTTPFLGPTIPITVEGNEVIEVMFYMPKKHTMLDMNISINLDSSNLPISISSVEENVKSTMKHYLGYGLFLCYFFFYLVIVWYLLNIGGEPIFAKDKKGTNLRKLYVGYFFSGGFAFILLTGIIYKYIGFGSNCIAHFDSILVNIFASLNIICGAKLFERSVRVTKLISTFKYYYKAILFVAYSNITLTLMFKIDEIWFKHLAIEWYWYFYDFRLIAFLVSNIVVITFIFYYLSYKNFEKIGVKKLIAAWRGNLFKKKRKRDWLEDKHLWMWIALAIYIFIFLGILYAISPFFRSLFPFLEGINPYIFVYISTVLFAILLTAFVVYRINLLITSNSSRFQLINKIERDQKADTKDLLNEVYLEVHNEAGKYEIKIIKHIDKIIEELEGDLTDKIKDELTKDLPKYIRRFKEYIQRTINEFERYKTTKLKKEIDELMEDEIYKEIIFDIDLFENIVVSHKIFSSVKELLYNAVKYGTYNQPEKTTVKATFLCKHNMDNLYIVVSDNGKGIDEKLIDWNKESGISEIKKFIEKDLNGKFTLETEMDEGTNIKLLIPPPFILKNPEDESDFG